MVSRAESNYENVFRCRVDIYCLQLGDDCSIFATGTDVVSEVPLTVILLLVLCHPTRRTYRNRAASLALFTVLTLPFQKKTLPAMFNFIAVFADTCHAV